MLLWPLRSNGTALTGFGTAGTFTEIAAASKNVADVQITAVDSGTNADIVVSDAENHYLSWWHSNGAGGVLALNGISRVPRSLDAVPGAIALGDITGDTKPDLVVAYPDADFARVSLHTNIST